MSSVRVARGSREAGLTRRAKASWKSLSKAAASRLPDEDRCCDPAARVPNESSAVADEGKAMWAATTCQARS
jgi:hypothetical protein